MGAGGRLRVLLADDHVLVREAVAEMLEAEGSFEVVAHADDGARALELAGLHKPEVVLLDVEMPVMGAEEAIGGILEASPGSRVVILTMYEDAGLVRGLLARGASAYLTKTVPRDELISTIKSVAGGEDRTVLSLSRNVFKGTDGEDAARLSERESEILLYVARGMSNAQIAATLYLTEGTIKRHLHNVYAKLGVSSRGEATRKALLEGWITARDITGTSGDLPPPPRNGP